MKQKVVKGRTESPKPMYPKKKKKDGRKKAIDLLYGEYASAIHKKLLGEKDKPLNIDV